MIDNVIRTALDEAAALTPPGGPVRTRIDARLRGRRQRRMVLAGAAGVAATAAIGVPAVILGRGPEEVEAGADVAPSSNVVRLPQPAPGAGNKLVPMRFRANWVPTGYQATFRAVGSEPRLDSLSWTGRNREHSLWLMDLGGVALPAGPPTKTTVLGRPARLWRGERSTLVWEAQAGVELFLEGHPNGDDLLRMARSVVFDGADAIEQAVDFGWLPPGTPRTDTISLTAGEGVEFSQELSSSGAFPSGAYANVTLKKADWWDFQPADSEPVTIQGRPGRYQHRSVQVLLPGGRQLTVFSNFTKEQVVRVANELRVGPSPDVSWAG